MNCEYIKALEKKGAWIQAASADLYVLKQQSELAILYSYLHPMHNGDTFFMNKNFCQLVDFARESIPDDTAFEPTWMQARTGWLWLETPFKLPQFILGKEGEQINFPVEMHIAAIGWFPFPEEQARLIGAPFDAYYFVFYIDKGADFAQWAHLSIKPGDKLIDRLHEFETVCEKNGGSYGQDRSSEMLHEIRWLYAALHIMAQRLAHHSETPVDRATRRRAERLSQPVPKSIRVISLRRLEEDRKKQATTGEPVDVDWQWQWEVRGHWRNQYYASDKTHRQIFVEAYIKGPEDKPLKPPGVKLFTAIR